MEKIRTIIIDDEPLGREGMRVLLERDADIEIVGECANGYEAIAAIGAVTPDLIFLDVQMPEMDGFEVLAQIAPEHLPVVVFVTAFDEYALRAFEVHALDYLLKSYSDDRFEAALRRAKEQIRQKKVNAISRRLLAMLNEHHGNDPAAEISRDTRENFLQRLVIKAGGRVYFLKTHEIDWIEAADYYVSLHAGGKSHLLREPLHSLERRIDPAKFQRIHRSTIVNLDRIQELQPNAHGDYVVILRDGTQLKMSRAHRQSLESILGRRI